MKKKLHAGWAVGIFLVLVAVLVFLLQMSRPDTVAGEKHITVDVIHGDGTAEQFSYDTDAEYLGEVLLAEGLISGTEGAYGIYVDTVDGETASYEANQSWWKLLHNGEDAQTGADTIVIQDGDEFVWIYTIG